MPYRVLRRMVLAGKPYKRGDTITEKALGRIVSQRHKAALVAAGYVELVEAEEAAGGGGDAAEPRPARRRRRRRAAGGEG